jgi:hypothetical protein
MFKMSGGRIYKILLELSQAILHYLNKIIKGYVFVVEGFF